MSRKSEFNNWLSLEGPGIQGELPHHLQTLGGGRRKSVVVIVMVLKFGDSYFLSFEWHNLRRNYTIRGVDAHGYVPCVCESMFERFRQRSYELENIDKGTYTPEEYDGCIVELRRVNKWLGDTAALRDSLLKEIECQHLRSFSVLDVGAGSGELLRVTARWARETSREASLVGLELNERSANAILDESDEFPEISSVRADGLTLPFSDNSFDYVIQSLTLHHFDDAGAVSILREMDRVAARGIFVIDLHRNPMAYFLYTTVGRIILHNRLLREDGALSILKSFTLDEMAQLGQEAGLANVTVEKHFPSRLVLSARSTPEVV